jgi:hypothetical protein
MNENKDLDMVIVRLQGAKGCGVLFEMNEEDPEGADYKAAERSQNSLMEDAKVLLDELIKSNS